jgi:acyl-CoA thioester hydrolase
MGIVHHSRYLPMVEEARIAYLRHIGHPYQEIRKDNIEMNVLEAFVQYRKPLLFDDIVDVHTTLTSVERASFQMAYLLTVDGEIRSTAVTAHGCASWELGQEREPSGELRPMATGIRAGSAAAKRALRWLPRPSSLLRTR